jgi:hypothetical protein
MLLSHISVEKDVSTTPTLKSGISLCFSTLILAVNYFYLRISLLCSVLLPNIAFSHHDLSIPSNVDHFGNCWSSGPGTKYHFPAISNFVLRFSITSQIAYIAM